MMMSGNDVTYRRIRLSTKEQNSYYKLYTSSHILDWLKLMYFVVCSCHSFAADTTNCHAVVINFRRADKFVNHIGAMQRGV